MPTHSTGAGKPKHTFYILIVVFLVNWQSLVGGLDCSDEERRRLAIK